MLKKNIDLTSITKGIRLVNHEGRLPRKFLGQTYPSEGEYSDCGGESTYCIKHCNIDGYCKQTTCDMDEEVCTKQICDNEGNCYKFPLESCNYERDCSYKNIEWYFDYQKVGNNDLYKLKACNSKDKKCYSGYCISPEGGDKTECRTPIVEKDKSCHQNCRDKDCYGEYCAPGNTTVKGLCTYEGCKVYQCSSEEGCLYYECGQNFQNCDITSPKRCTPKEMENVCSETNFDVSVTVECSTNTCKLTKCDDTNKKCSRALCGKNGKQCTEWIPCINSYNQICGPDKEEGENGNYTVVIILIIMGILILLAMVFLVRYFLKEKK